MPSDLVESGKPQVSPYNGMLTDRPFLINSAPLCGWDLQPGEYAEGDSRGGPDHSGVFLDLLGARAK